MLAGRNAKGFDPPLPAVPVRPRVSGRPDVVVEDNLLEDEGAHGVVGRRAHNLGLGEPNGEKVFGAIVDARKHLRSVWDKGRGGGW